MGSDKSNQNNDYLNLCRDYPEMMRRIGWQYTLRNPRPINMNTDVIYYPEQLGTIKYLFTGSRKKDKDEQQ